MGGGGQGGTLGQLPETPGLGGCTPPQSRSSGRQAEHKPEVVGSGNAAHPGAEKVARRRYLEDEGRQALISSEPLLSRSLPGPTANGRLQSPGTPSTRSEAGDPGARMGVTPWCQASQRFPQKKARKATA